VLILLIFLLIFAFQTSASNCLEDGLRNVLSATLNLKHLLTYSDKESCKW